MIVFNRDRIWLSLLVFFTITSIIIFYIINEIITSKITEQIAEKQILLSQKISQYETTKTELVDYQTKIKALTPETLDKDFLEEEARLKLNYSKKNEVVIFR